MLSVMGNSQSTSYAWTEARGRKPAWDRNPGTFAAREPWPCEIIHRVRSWNRICCDRAQGYITIHHHHKQMCGCQSALIHQVHFPSTVIAGAFDSCLIEKVVIITGTSVACGSKPVAIVDCNI